jgi:hypothetical protein
MVSLLSTLWVRFLELNKILRFTTSFFEILYFILLFGSIYSFISIFSTVAPVNQEINIDTNEPVIIPLTFAPVNNGFLEADLSVSLDLMLNSETIAADSGKVILPPRSMEQINLELSISPSDAIRCFSEDSDITWVTVIETSTLFGLFRISDEIYLVGGI